MKMSRAKLNELKLPVQVSFLGELAVDEGGPSREFFGLVFQELAQSSLLTGCPGSQCFSSHTPLLGKNLYKLAGQLVSLSFLNGGPGPHLFCVAIAERITYGKRISPLKVEDVPDCQLKEHLIKVLYNHLCYAKFGASVVYSNVILISFIFKSQCLPHYALKTVLFLYIIITCISDIPGE